jgi:thiopeptide-type bacteriocin biosynthesis protein
MTARWLALHVFYGADQDTAIVEAIGPTLRRLRASGSISRYFFVRYWNGGPHLRVRLECLRSVAEVERAFRQGIKPFFHEATFDVADVRHYTEESARMHAWEQRLAGDQEGLVEPLEPVQPSCTIQARPYRFDEKRYGGPSAEEDTHDHFCASTRIACSVLELTAKNPASRPVFALHAAAIVPAVLEASDSVALEYFTRCGELEPDLDHIPGERRWQDRDFLPYASQRAALEDVRALLDRRNPSAPEFWLLLLEGWRSELRRRREFLIHARGAHGLQVHPDHLIIVDMHLFLNRLGIGLTVECYLYYLIAGTLRDRITTVSNTATGTLT